MDLQHWQTQFENWLKNHHQHQDAAHDVCHFRRVWATAQKLAADDDVDMLVILTACYFHDIVSLAKIIRNGSVFNPGGEETRRLLREEFEQFPAEKSRPFVMPLPLTVSARKSPPNNGS
ncbi:HD domain-containing protein [Escherichia coli]